MWVEADGGAKLVIVVEGEGDGCAEFVGDRVREVEDVDVGGGCEGEDAEVRRGLSEWAVGGVVGEICGVGAGEWDSAVGAWSAVRGWVGATGGHEVAVLRSAGNVRRRPGRGGSGRLLLGVVVGQLVLVGVGVVQMRCGVAPGPVRT